MGGKNKKQTVGYKYYIGMHMILCHGPVDRLMRIRVDEKTAWQGNQYGSGPVKISAENLFGGESREGGISGTVDFEVGGPTQGKNSYLVSKLGNDVPSFRGVVGAVLRQVYVGLSPYLKKWDFRLSRIHVRQNGIPQWYDEKAEITVPVAAGLTYDSTWKYKYVPGGGIPGTPSEYTQPDFDDSTWPEGQGTFGNYHDYRSPSPGIKTTVPLSVGDSIWIRRVITRSEVGGGPLNIHIAQNDGAWVWWNGVSYPVDNETFGYFHGLVRIPKAAVLDSNTLVVQVIDGYPSGSSGGEAGVMVTGDSTGDMNPAHIIRECLTDPDWGMGYQDADIDDTSFMAAADTLYDEGMGISILWDRQMPIEDFIKEILKHIDAVLYVDRTTGKFVLRLIRRDYNAEDLLLLNEDNIIKLDGFQRTAFGELTNSVTVNYWDSETGNTASLTVQDIALAQMQGAVINTTVQYPGFTNSAIASRVAQRDLKSLSTPLITCTIYANQDAKDLNIGDVFRLAWKDYELDPIVMRVNSIAYGDGKKNQIKITAVQDVFALPTTAVVSPSPLPPVQSITPVPVSTRQVFEVPYLELVQVRGQTEIDYILAADPLAGFVGAAAIRPLSGAINARMLVDAGAGYEEIGALEFAPGAKLASAIGRTETTLPIQDGVDLDQVVLGTWLQCDSEIMAVTALSDTSITVKRGCLDTVPAPHAAGAALVFWDNYARGDERQYASGETVNVKLQTVTGEGVLPAEQAPEDVVTMSARAARPYPPGAVRINSQWFPEVIGGTEALSLSWAHRDRKQQTGQNLIGFTDGSIGPEPGTTYTLRLYGETDTLLRTETGLTGTGYTWTAEEADSGLTVPGVGGADYSAQVLADAPISYWKLDETSGTTATDAVGGNNGTYIGGYALNQPGIPSTGRPSVLLDGSSGYVNLGAPAALNLTAAWTLEAWIYLVSSPSNGNGIICEGVSGDNRVLYALSLGGQGVAESKLSVGFYNGAWRSAKYDPPLALNTWHHVVGVWDGTNLRLYLNGTLVASNTPGSAPSAGMNSLYIGRRWDTAGTPFFPGRIDEVAIYPIALSAARVLAHYNAGIAATNRLNGRIRVELESVRDGLTSHQKHNITVDRAGWGYQYGNYYGGSS